MPVRIAYCASRWYDDVALAVRDLADLGYRGIELVALSEDLEREEKEQEKELAILADFLKQTGLQVCAVNLAGSFVEKERLQRELWYFRQTLKMMTRLGCHVVVVSAGRKRRGKETQDWTTLLESIRTLGRMTCDAGVQLTIHPNVATLVSTSEAISRVAAETRPQLVKFTFDTWHLAQMPVPLIQAFEQHIGRIAHVHFKDTKDDDYVELGKGCVDFPGVYRVLKDHGYDGWISVELDASPNAPKESARISLDYLRRQVGIDS